MDIMIDKKFKIFALAFTLVTSLLLCNIATASDNQIKSNDKLNSFVWALSSGLQNIGITVSVDKVQACIGTAFGPNLSTKTLCLSEAIQINNDNMLTNVLLGFGLKETRFPIGNKIWSKAIARQFIRNKILYALAETNIILMQGGWKLPAGKTTWGVVDAMDFNGKLSGQTQWGNLPQELSPKNIIILSIGNESDSPDVFREKILKSAIGQLNKSILLQSSSRGLLTGYDLINYIADMAHRSPFCSKCKQKSYICMHKILNTFYDDLGSGVRYLNSTAQQCPDYEKKEIIAAAEKLATGRDILHPFLDLNKLKTIMADRKSQAEMGESIRKLKGTLTDAAYLLAAACNEETEKETKNLNISDWSGKREDHKIVRTLPGFNRLYGLNNTFFISVTLAAEILDIKRPAEWFIGVSGYSFKFLINSNTFTYVSDISTGYDCMEKYITGAGLVPTFYTFDINMSPETGNMIRKKIVENIDKSAPSIISVSGTSNQWGIVTGYKDYGLNLLCRLPADSNYFFSAVREIPDTTIIIRKKKTQPAMRSQVKNILNQLLLLHGQTNFSEYLSGDSAISLWIDKCRYYSNRNVMPSLHFAQQNQILWLALRDNLRKTYRVLDIAMTVMPELVVPLNEARGLYVKAVDELNITYADDDVLKTKRGVIYPLDWNGEKSGKQIQTLEKVRNLINEASNHVKLAAKQL